MKAFRLLMMNQHGTITVEKHNSNGDKLGAGFVFKITADEDIYNVARTVKYYNKGDTVATITTSSAGIASKSDLPLGRYLINEQSVVSGYLLNTETKKIHLKYKDQVSPVVYESVSFTNDEPTGTLEITKDDIITGNNERVDKTYKHGDAEIAGAVYTLYANKKITNVLGTVTYFNKGDEIATFTFDKRGFATVKITNTKTTAKLQITERKLTGIPLGEFILKETIVPERIYKR